ncbi:MAG: type II secretion system major pseudopilin GspG [Gammaproteobacteria bacterium]|nr:type II secretion system major pseudopilin GspG [Gammaproteobacteria bacterium]
MNKKYQRAGNKGFSLIELLVVITIMGLLASLVGQEMFGKVEQSKVKTAQSQMKIISSSLDAYRLDIGEYPENLNLLINSQQQGWLGPYLADDLPLDPWNVPYQYKRLSASTYQLSSLGADKKPGGDNLDADIIH